MPTPAILTKSKYRTLVADIRRFIEEGRTLAKQAIAQELVQTYWQVGKRIHQEKLTQNAGYGDSVMQDLSAETGVDPKTLNRAVLFFGLYRKGAPRGTHLSWAHYRELIPLREEGARVWYEKRSSEQGWTRDQLVKAIREARYEKKGQSKEARNALRLKRPKAVSYIYKAQVMRVIDGGTLLLNIDLGFTVFKEQRVRLEGIEAADLKTQKGRAAFEYVRDQLAQAPFVVVKTNKIDIYGRYVAHVFYSFKNELMQTVYKKGVYLNQSLVTRGLGQRL